MIESMIESVRVVAPEDLCIGDYVVTHGVIEAYHCVHCEPGSVITTRYERLPGYCELPARVLAVCLPFVSCERAEGGAVLHDVRRERLAVVPEAFAREVWAVARSESEREPLAEEVDP